MAPGIYRIKKIDRLKHKTQFLTDYQHKPAFSLLWLKRFKIYVMCLFTAFYEKYFCFLLPVFSKFTSPITSSLSTSLEKFINYLKDLGVNYLFKPLFAYG